MRKINFFFSLLIPFEEEREGKLIEEKGVKRRRKVNRRGKEKEKG
jgi:hypothetical protein